MSVSLSIRWPDGAFEDIPISSQRGGEWWAEEARRLGLELVPQFHQFLGVEPDLLDQLIAEVDIFRQAMAERGAGYEETVDSANRVLDALDRLKKSSGWRASLG